jgi:hypothetical protein
MKILLVSGNRKRAHANIKKLKLRYPGCEIVVIYPNRMAFGGLSMSGVWIDELAQVKHL